MSSSGKSATDAGVFDLITELCHSIASKYCAHNRLSQNHLANKLRARSYEILLKKTSIEIHHSDRNPVADLLLYYFVSQQNAKNVAEYKKCVKLKKVISDIRQHDFGEDKVNIDSVLKFLVSMSDTQKSDLTQEMYQQPFSFGMFDDMLPKPPQEEFGSPQPYSYYPSHIFELPYSLKRQAMSLQGKHSQAYTEYTVESYDSKSILADATSRKVSTELKTFLSPMSLVSVESSRLSPYSDSMMLNYPRLTAPRDLQIPSPKNESNVKVSFLSCNSTSDMNEVYRADLSSSNDIWELATQIDKDVPNDIWDEVSKLPPVNERQMIASSVREMEIWRSVYGSAADFTLVSEKQFIRHLMYLVIGVETSSFPFCKETHKFYMKKDLVLEGVSQGRLLDYVSDLICVGTYYKRLYRFAFNQTLDDHFHSNGLIYEAARQVIRRYLLRFRLSATEIYEECARQSKEDVNCLPTLLQILYHMEPLKREIETVATIFKVVDDQSDSNTSIPTGAELMSYLFSEISLVTHRETARTMFTALFNICKVYFKFIERLIFEGELDDRYNEFFIRKDSQYVNCRSKRYWDKGFHITQSVAVPEFLRPLAKLILLCGKSLRLLKLCNPSDPLVMLISSDHPSISCCASFPALQRQQKALDVYRTRCRFVCGDPIGLHTLLMRRELDDRARAAAAASWQQDTMEKIIAERKRLAQLIVAEKQHALRVLEAAMAEAKAAKLKAKQQERMRFQLEQEANKAAEEVDSILREDESNKIMEYYSKLNMEVEKSKIHTEWKIKRLHLEQSRIQLLSSEERNLKREKLELEHQRNEEMAMSIQSIDYDMDSESKDVVDKDEIEIQPTMIESTSSVSLEVEDNITYRLQAVEEDVCGNTKKLDSQGNIVLEETEQNSNTVKSSDVIGHNLNSITDNIEFLKTRHEAVINRQKVMAHEFNRVDEENNIPNNDWFKIDVDNNIEDATTPFAEARRNKLKVLGDEFGMKVDEVKQASIATPITDAQKEAVINKLKVLGVEYNLPLKIATREPITQAQEEAVKNKKKVLGSESSLSNANYSPKKEMSKRSNLTLNLKPYGETVESNLAITPNTGAVTPGDIFPGLDIETPTTADVPTGSALTCNVFTPQLEDKKYIEDEVTNKEQTKSEGFSFPIVCDDTTDAEVITDSIPESPQNSPSKFFSPATSYKEFHSVFNIIDGSYNLDSFDPFGVKDWQNYTKNHFNNKMSNELNGFCYTHPAVIMEEVKKPPYSNIFASHLENDSQEEIDSDNVASLTACLQRSVMLPLTYQLEVVNNSILTHFLMNLDMYEHLRSLKDYFFLMDGEFSRSICNNLFSKLTKTLNPQELLNYATLHNILDKALGSSISHVHKFSENLSFTMTDSPLSFLHSSPDVLQCLSLTYSVCWPLNIIISQEALLRYAKVFQFLIKMRRVFWVLSENFQELKLSVKLSRQHSRRLLRSPHYISIQIYRHVMASMIRALDNYIVTTCILSSWTEFETDLKKATTLDDLYECHAVYIKKVLFRCLLNNRSTLVMKLLNDMFTVILKFSRVLKAGEWHQKEPNGHFSHTNFAQLEELFHLFEKLAKYLHKVVVKLMECGYQRHLVELLTMINLNGYYDPQKTKEDQNCSAVSNS